ncbi:S8 family serine peptidase [bacterium]|nr:S8 family serine peptidase [bacterium]
MPSHSEFIHRAGSHPPRRSLSVLVICAWAWPGGWPAHAQEQEAPEYIPGRFIVMLREDGEADDNGNHRKLLQASLAEIQATPGVQVDHVYEHAIHGFAGEMTDAAVERLKADPRVAHIEQDQVVRVSSRRISRARLRATSRGSSTNISVLARGGSARTAAQAQAVPWGIARIGAQRSTAAAGNGSGDVNVDVAIIDTGIDLSHPDLNVAGGQNFSGGSSTDYGDGNGHGTHVSGIVGAKDNAFGVVGVAPGARLWSVRVLGSSGSGTLSGVIAGVDWVRSRASTIEVANMSLGASDSSSLKTAIDRAVASGVTFVVAAGNESRDTSTSSPANSTNTGVITVSALTSAGTVAYYSNYGRNYVDQSGAENGVDVIAPGDSIYSTYRNASYTTMSGTSMASPHVAGVAALCKVLNPRYTPAQVKASVVRSAPSTYLSTSTAGVSGRSPWSATSGDRDGFYEPLVNAGAY